MIANPNAPGRPRERKNLYNATSMLRKGLMMSVSNIIVPILDGESFAAFGTSTREDFATIGRRHTSKESVFAFAFVFFGLECALHKNNKK